MTRGKTLALGLVLVVGVPLWGQVARAERVAKKAKRTNASAPPDVADIEDADDDAVVTDDTTSDRSGKRASKGEAKPTASSDDSDTGESDERRDRRPPDGREKQETREPANRPAPAGTSKAQPFVKQDLSGHDLGADKKENEFERDRFFVDKIDTPATENGTLIQGSLTSSSLAYLESGGTYPPASAGNTSPGSNAAAYSRYFTDLRLQTDFRHIAGSRWEARVDARVRVVNSPTAPPEPATGAPNPRIQSGLTGQSEYEVRELWLIRSGARTDFILGRQFIADLGAVKIDGLRFDYANSPRLTLIGFGGLYPLRGSRSLTTDYLPLKDPGDPTQSAGRFVGAGGFGAAYRTPTAYGAFGGVALVPLQKEQPRVFATASGYYRPGTTLDVYHLALIDVVSASGAQITNLSAGLNYKPNQRLRVTTNIHHVDTDSLNIQAAAFYDTPQPNAVVQNELALKRVATTTARASVSAGLGHLQRFELTAATAFRYRPALALRTYASGGLTPMTIQLDAAKSVEVYGSILDRRSLLDTRIGIDALKTYGVGTVAFQRSELLGVRGFLSRAIMSGRGEWQAEASYLDTKDSGFVTACAGGATCFGQSAGQVLSAGGAVYYRYRRDWFFLAQLYGSITNIKSGTAPADPPIRGISAYLRIAYRF